MSDEAEGDLVRERNAILQLQSDYSRKKEQLDRLKQKSQALEDELKTRTAELESVREESQAELRRAQKIKQGGASSRTAEAENDFMSSEVRRLLQGRLPAMAPVQDGADTADAGQLETKDDQKDDNKELHDTVLVSYVNLAGDKKDEDYKVSYRIDETTTVADLLRDACDYWGCSQNDYCLCKVDGSDVPMDLSNRKEERLQEAILDPQEQSHLHLVQRKEMELFRAANERQAEREKQARQKEAPTDAGQAEEEKLKTLKFGLGSVTDELPTEPFVEALKPWPGVHNLLKNRKRKPQQRKWLRTPCADFCCFGILILLTLLSLLFRYEVDYYMLRAGVSAPLMSPMPSQSELEESAFFFNNITTVETYFEFLGRFLDNNLFEASSTLRQYYKLVGSLRIRVKVVTARNCERPVPAALASTCYYVQVNSDTESTADLILSASTLAGLSALEATTVGLVQGSLTSWRKSTVATADVPGIMQDTYDGSGYQIWYDSNPDWITPGIQGSTVFPSPGDRLKLAGQLLAVELGASLRFVSVDFTLANYNLGGYVSVNIVGELSPSGALHPSAVLLPFYLTRGSGDRSVLALDALRWIIVIAYMLLYRVFALCEKEVVNGRSGLRYVFSVGGLTDAVLIALWIAFQYSRFKVMPPEPSRTVDQRDFVSYSYFATLQEQLAIGESIFFLVLLCRYTSFLRMIPDVYRLYKVLQRSICLFLYYLTIFIPIIISSIYLANCIWSPYVLDFSTWTNSYMAILLGVQNNLDLTAMYKASGVWSFVFMIYMFLIVVALFTNVFLAISVQAYFEVELIEGSNARREKWTIDQWLDWALWGSVYNRITGKDPGSSYKISVNSDDELAGDEEEDEDAEE